MLNITERHQLILKKLKEEGKLNILDLIEEMNVSGVTIRKDLKLLEDKNLLYRTRGGASITNPYMIEKPIKEKEFINSDKKSRIAEAAEKLIGDNDSIMIGSGTTVFALAHRLNPKHHITVITPAVKVTMELCNRPNIEVLQLGGLIRPNSSSVAGANAENTLKNLSCGILFLGVDGIDLDFGLSITNLAEATLNQRMIETADAVAIMADSSKFGRRGLGKVCDFEAIRYIITDRDAPAKIVNQLEEKGIQIIIAD